MRFNKELNLSAGIAKQSTSVEAIAVSLYTCITKLVAPTRDRDSSLAKVTSVSRQGS